MDLPKRILPAGNDESSSSSGVSYPPDENPTPRKADVGENLLNYQSTFEPRVNANDEEVKISEDLIHSCDSRKPCLNCNRKRRLDDKLAGIIRMCSSEDDSINNDNKKRRLNIDGESIRETKLAGIDAAHNSSEQYKSKAKEKTSDRNVGPMVEDDDLDTESEGDREDDEEEESFAAQVLLPKDTSSKAAVADDDEDGWDDELHKVFVATIFELGLKNCSPSVIMGNMNNLTPFVTRERTKSHLQKYRKTREKGKQELFEEYGAFMKAAHKIESTTTEDGDQKSPDDVVSTVLGTRSSNELLGGEAIALVTYLVKKSCNTETNIPAEVPPGQDISLPNLTENEKKSSLGMSLLYVKGLMKHMTNYLTKHRQSASKPNSRPTSYNKSTIKKPGHHEKSHPHETSSSSRNTGSEPPPEEERKAPPAPVSHYAYGAPPSYFNNMIPNVMQYPGPSRPPNGNFGRPYYDHYVRPIMQAPYPYAPPSFHHMPGPHPPIQSMPHPPAHPLIQPNGNKYSIAYGRSLSQSGEAMYPNTNTNAFTVNPSKSCTQSEESKHNHKHKPVLSFNIGDRATPKGQHSPLDQWSLFAEGGPSPDNSSKLPTPITISSESFFAEEGASPANNSSSSSSSKPSTTPISISYDRNYSYHPPQSGIHHYHQTPLSHPHAAASMMMHASQNPYPYNNIAHPGAESGYSPFPAAATYPHNSASTTFPPFDESRGR
jgi:SHAQKYF class myb-like DNA-binding protein